MPLYEYSCSKCGHRFEVLQRMGEGAEGLRCPQCGFESVHKQFSTFAASGGESAKRVSMAGAGCCKGASKCCPT